MKGLLGSVGKAGKNIRQDVRLVQELLNHKLHLLHNEKKLFVDGHIGPKTNALIVKFQSTVLKMKNPDGRVDPGGRSYRELIKVNTGKTTTPKTEPATTQQWTGDSSRWAQEKKLLSMNPDLRTKVRAVLEDLKAENFKPKVFFGWRSEAVQLDLYNKKRTTVKFSFHNATKKDGTPNSYAADIIDSRYAWSEKPETKKFWEALGKSAKKHGLYWGGDWKSFKDWAHVQMFDNSKLSVVRKASAGHN